MEQFIKNLGKGMTIGLGFVIIAGIGYVGLKARTPDSTGLTAESGDTLTVDKWNNLVPNTMVGAFLSATCPTGRKPADGSDGTTDLRGQFLRGLNTFDGGSTTRADGKQDPDGASRSIGGYQADELKSHNHFYKRLYGGVNGTAAPIPSTAGTDTTQSTLYAGGTETRGKNIAVIFCVKK